MLDRFVKVYKVYQTMTLNEVSDKRIIGDFTVLGNTLGLDSTYTVKIKGTTSKNFMRIGYFIDEAKPKSKPIARIIYDSYGLIIHIRKHLLTPEVVERLKLWAGNNLVEGRWSKSNVQ